MTIGNVLTKEQVYTFVSFMGDTGRMYSCDDCFGFFLRLNAEQIDKIKQNPRMLASQEVMKDMLAQNGKNIHFFGVYGNKGRKQSVMSMIRGIREVARKEDAESISWVNKELNKFIYRRIKCQ